MSGAIEPIWKIWANPVAVKSWRARLRPKAAIPRFVVAFILTAFVYMSVFQIMTERGGRPDSEAAMGGLIAVLLIQGIYLMFLGTSTVAALMSGEKERGVLDYQRMTPLPPAHKIVGYLAGLPCREYLMFATTLPFLIISIVVGEIPVLKVMHLYSMFFLAVWLYHLTGMAAGMIAKGPRGAVVMSTGMVICLYVFVPGLSNAGLSGFEFLTVRPVVFGVLADELSRFDVFMGDIHRWQQVPFFDFKIHATLYCVMVQIPLATTFYMIVYRKWRDANKHELSKPFAVGLYGLVQFLLAGSCWPALTDPSSIRRLGGIAGEFGPLGIVAMTLIVFALFNLVLALLLLAIITPTEHTFASGLRRAQKHGRVHSPLGADTASSLPHGLAMALMAAATSFVLMDLVAQHGFFKGNQPPNPMMLGLLMAMIILAAQGATATGHRRGLFMFMFVCWVVPMLVSLLMVITNDGLVYPALVISAPSPVAAVAYAVFQSLGLPVVPVDNAANADQIARQQSNFYLAVSLVMAMALLALTQWRGHRKQQRLTRRYQNLSQTAG